MTLVNMYFQQMIKITSACGGDVIKFAGDAIIVLWTQGEMSTQAHRACECAMDLQDALHDCPMTEQIRLSLKIGIGCGSATMFYVGGHEGRCEYFAAGSSLRDCFNAADVAASGDVIVASSVWEHVESTSTASEVDSDGFRALLSMEQTFRKRSVQRTAIPANVLCNSLRSYTPPALLAAHDLEVLLGQSLRSWTVSVVQASIVFINLGLTGLMDQLELDCQRIHKAVLTVQQVVHALQGCIHRFTVDDKGCVMKVVFGAQSPHEDQPYRALLAALQLRHALSMQGIQPSIGVASGESLIGPVGSAVRQEFTVHGDTIILAARLMQLAAKYGGMVLCDEQTYFATREDVRFVTLQPTTVKGKSVVIQPYRPVASSELLEKPALAAKLDTQYHAPVDTAAVVLERCKEWLLQMEPAFRAVVITGAHGAGKTQLTMQARQVFEASCRVLHVRCREHEAVQEGALLRRIFAQLCRHDVWPSLQHITPMLASDRDEPMAALMEYELQLLRSHATPISASKLEANAFIESMREVDRDGSKEQNRGSFIASASDRRLAIIIDDVHHADFHSCEVLKRLVCDAPPGHALLLLTCREPRVSLGAPQRSQGHAPEAENQLTAGHRLVHKLSRINAGVTSVDLRPLSTSNCVALACASLGVSALPEGVKSVMAQRSGGNPLLCQAIAQHIMSRTGMTIEEGTCRMSSMSSERRLNRMATEALVKARHGFLSVKIAELSMLLQLVLKTMALLPEPCSQDILGAAVPVQLDRVTLLSQLQELRERHIITVPRSHRRSLPTSVISESDDSCREAGYVMVDVGMREVCQHLMIESQKRQIRLRVAAAYQSKAMLGDLADSVTSSSLAYENNLAHSLSSSFARNEARATGAPLDGAATTGGGASPDWWLVHEETSQHNSKHNGTHLVQRLRRHQRLASATSTYLGRSPSSRSIGRWSMKRSLGTDATGSLQGSSYRSPANPILSSAVFRLSSALDRSMSRRQYSFTRSHREAGLSSSWRSSSSWAEQLGHRSRGKKLPSSAVSLPSYRRVLTLLKRFLPPYTRKTLSASSRVLPLPPPPPLDVRSPVLDAASSGGSS